MWTSLKTRTNISGPCIQAVFYEFFYSCLEVNYYLTRCYSVDWRVVYRAYWGCHSRWLRSRGQPPIQGSYVCQVAVTFMLRQEPSWGKNYDHPHSHNRRRKCYTTSGTTAQGLSATHTVWTDACKTLWGLHNVCISLTRCGVEMQTKNHRWGPKVDDTRWMYGMGGCLFTIPWPSPGRLISYYSQVHGFIGN